jgi:hypothetical protein
MEECVVRYSNARIWQGFPGLLAVVLAMAVPAQARDDPPPSAWQPVAAAAGGQADIAGLQALLVQFPDSAAVRRRLLNAYLEAERPADALDEAAELARRGYAFSPAAQAMLLSLEPTPAQREAFGLQAANGVPIEASRLLAEVPADVRLVESVWRDPKSGDLFATSVVSRALHVWRGGGAWVDVPLERAGSLSGLAVDPASGLLWIGSGVFDQTPDPATAFRGVIAIDPASGQEKRRIAAPEGGSPSDLAVGADGTVYASDPVSGAVYLGRPGAERLETLIAPGTFRSPQGIAELPGTSRIIVSDYGYGLALVDVATSSVHRVATDTGFLLDGIDGLWRDGERLIGVQNGARPMRIVELRLSPDGTRVVAAQALERAHGAWTEPVGGNVSDGELVYVATGQWDRFGDGGAVTGDRPPLSTEIRALPLAP